MNEAGSRGITAASQQFVREVNAGMLLRLLRESGPMTGSELMELSGLTRATVIAICEDLMDRGWVQELENQRAAGDYVKGRPARRFAFRERAAYVLGIDIAQAAS